MALKSAGVDVINMANNHPLDYGPVGMEDTSRIRRGVAVPQTGGREQQSGPPASPRQIQELLTLLQDAGHRDFRDARGPLGFTQRQAAGKFSRDEVAEFIERLQEDEVAVSTPDPSGGAIGPSEAGATMRDVPAERLAAELRRRGWIVIEP